MVNKKIIIIIVIIAVICIAIGMIFVKTNKKSDITDTNNTTNTIIERNETSMIILNVNDTTLYIKPENNSSSTSFIEQLKKDEIVINAQDYGNFEKVGDLGFLLPTNDEKITTEAGDLILYQGNKITLYYDTNTWDFTRLGKVQNVSQEELKNILGAGDVTYTDEALYENKLSVFFEDIEKARKTLDNVREFVKNNPTVYLSTHTPLGYENLENKKIIDLDNPPESIPPKDIFIKQPSGKYVCSICGYVYDPVVGDPESGIPAGTRFEDLPENWLCPRCKQGKDKFNRA